MTGYAPVPLASVCNIAMGQAPSGDSYNTEGSGYPLIAGAGDFGDTTPSPGKWTTAPTKLSEIGDIILCIRATIGDRNWANAVYCLGRGVAGLRASQQKLDSKYLWYWLDQSADQLRAKGRGATFLQVSKADITTLEIPLPPLEEQKRIAGILDAADALRAKRRESLTQLDTLLQSTFLNLFGDPVTNPKGWDLVDFEDVVYFQEGPGVRKWQFRESGIKLINVKNIVDGELHLDNTNRYLQPEEVSKKYTHFLLDRGDLVMSSSGVTWGKIAYVKAEHIPLCLNTSMIRLRPKEDTINHSFIKAFIESESFRMQILRLITGSAQPNFGPSHLRKITIGLPPVTLQRRFASIVESVEQQKARMCAHLAELDTLFASLQSRAFNGEL